jgi:hypothetical protein
LPLSQSQTLRSAMGYNSSIHEICYVICIRKIIKTTSVA